MANEDTAIVEFILDTLPAPLVHALRTLAELAYPIDNAGAFEEALPKPKDDKDEVVSEVLRYAVGPPCFPLTSVRNAFEKFHANLPGEIRLTSFPLSLGGAISLLPEPLVTPELGRVDEAIRRWFACREDCRRRYEDCRRGLSAYDEYGAFRCVISYQLCLNRCG